MAEKIIELVTGASSPIELLCVVQEIPEEVDLTKALLIRKPVVKIKERNTGVSLSSQFKDSSGLYGFLSIRNSGRISLGARAICAKGCILATRSGRTPHLAAPDVNSATIKTEAGKEWATTEVRGEL